MGFEPPLSSCKDEVLPDYTIWPIFYGERNQLPLHFPLVSLCLLLSNYGVAVFSPTKHSSSCGNVTSAHLLLCYTSAVFGNGLFKGYTKNHLFFLLKIFGGPSLTVSLLCRVITLLTKNFCGIGRFRTYNLWINSPLLCHWATIPLLIIIFEEEVGFQPTRRDDYRPNGFQVRPLQALGYSSIIRYSILSTDYFANIRL